MGRATALQSLELQISTSNYKTIIYIILFIIIRQYLYLYNLLNININIALMFSKTFHYRLFVSSHILSFYHFSNACNFIINKYNRKRINMLLF